MKKIQLLLLALLLGFGASAQILVPKKDYVPEVRKSRYSFAISLVSGSHLSLVSYGIIREAPDSTKSFKYLSKSSFLRQITASEQSKANPEKINYLEKYEIHREVLDVLWKLKFSEYPYDGNDEKGWGSEKGRPSAGQYEMLREFGIEKISDYCYGDNLIRLMLKIDDPTWVQEYKNRR